jgi:hypothetical protein
MTSEPLKTDFTPHIELYSVWSFVKLPETGEVLGFRMVPMEISKGMGNDGKQAINPDGTRMYNVAGTTIVRVFSYDKYLKIMAMSEQKPPV